MADSAESVKPFDLGAPILTVLKKRTLSGWKRNDAEGAECRIGALWARLLLRDRWALTAFGKIWFKNPLTWRVYCRDPWWRAHEHHHLVQFERDFKGSNWKYLSTFVWQYIRYRSHDRAPLEIEANEAADRAIEKCREDSFHGTE